MDYLLSDRNTLIWLMFTIYVVSALFIVPNTILESSTVADNTNNDRALQLASRLLMRIALILPMIFIIRNTI